MTRKTDAQFIIIFCYFLPFIAICLLSAFGPGHARTNCSHALSAGSATNGKYHNTSGDALRREKLTLNLVLFTCYLFVIYLPFAFRDPGMSLR